MWLEMRASAPFDMQRGVARVSPSYTLSPILFALFIDDLLRELDEPHEITEVHASQAGVGRLDVREGQLPNILQNVLNMTASDWRA